MYLPYYLSTCHDQDEEEEEEEEEQERQTGGGNAAAGFFPWHLRQFRGEMLKHV